LELVEIEEAPKTEPETKSGPEEPSNANDSIVTDESCPDIESDSETHISYQQSIPRLMKI